MDGVRLINKLNPRIDHKEVEEEEEEIEEEEEEEEHSIIMKMSRV